MENFDLHNHTAASDGVMAPAALVDLAVRNGCDALALTDHDTTAGFAEAARAAEGHGLRLVPGVEISVTWCADADSKPASVHVVGLGIEIGEAGLEAGLASIRAGRIERAQRIDLDLQRVGISGMLDAAFGFAGNKSMISRTHFARALAAAGHVTDVQRAFNRYLTADRPGWVPHQWASLTDAVGWIRGAGGVAVLAHPGRYRLQAPERDKLFDEFKGLGGAAIEVVTGSHSPPQFKEYARLARRFGFMASRGSDFHGLGESHWQPGRLPPLPDDLTPVWRVLQ